MKVSIVIPTLNHLEDCLIPCISSLQKYTDLADTEAIIVANGCTDGTKQYLEGLASEQFRYVWLDKPAGFAKAVNQGIIYSRGEYIIILNNDVLLLPQEKNTWVNMLLAPFSDSKVGITGPLLGPSAPAGRDFIIFFCACISGRVIDEIGLLSEDFGVGAGEDTDYCIRAVDAGFTMVQVPGKAMPSGGLTVGGFPIFHAGEATVKGIPNWNEIFDHNAMLLGEKYQSDWYRWKISNNCERAVFFPKDEIYPREKTRYEAAAKNIVGRKVLEIGCSNGYGTRLLPKDIDYLGIDYDETIIKEARKAYGDENHDFVCANINEFEFGQYDTIIAFEILEHLDNGRELAQELKKHCKCLLVTTPYKEPVGFWGSHHKLHGLSEEDFPGFHCRYITPEGQLADEPDMRKKIIVDGVAGSENLMLMKWNKEVLRNNEVPPTKGNGLSVQSLPPTEAHAIEGRDRDREYSGKDVTAVVCTKGRYDTTLSLCLFGILNQSVIPSRLIIFDDTPDSERKDLREIPLFLNIFIAYDRKEIKWEVVFTHGKGQVFGHNLSVQMATTELIWRVDDDEIPGFDVLQILLENFREKVGAVGGLILDPKVIADKPVLASNKIQDIFLGLDIQWYPHTGLSEVDHLTSSFLYRRSIAEYPTDLSVVGHREETILTYQMKLKGYKLIVDPRCVTWHFRVGGGIRTFTDPSLWQHDEEIFKKKLEEWGIKRIKTCLVVLNNGLGDHLAFKGILPDLLRKYDNQVLLAVTFPEVFAEYDTPKISIAEAGLICNPEDFNIYGWMAAHNWKGTLPEAFRAMYGL